MMNCTNTPAVGSPPAPQTKAVAGGSSSKPPWKGKVASVKKVLLQPDEDLLEFSEVFSSISSSFPFALLDSGSAVYTAPSSSFLIDPISSLVPIGTQLTAANGTSIPSTTIISGNISPTLLLDPVFITPTIPFPIASVSSLCSNNNLVVFSSQAATIIPNNDLILTFSAPSDPLAIGVEWEVDFKGKRTGPDGRPSSTFQQQLYSFTAVDSSSKFVFARLCRNRLSVTAHLEVIRLFALESNRIIRYIRTDNEFITSTTTAWAASNKILFIPSIPHEYDTVRSVERVHRTLQEMVVKSLALKPHLSTAFWGLSYLHHIDILNIIPNATNVSPYYSWYSRPFDLEKTPLLPFG